MTEGVVHCPQRQWDCGFGIYKPRQQKHVLLFLIMLPQILRNSPNRQHGGEKRRGTLHAEGEGLWLSMNRES